MNGFDPSIMGFGTGTFNNMVSGQMMGMGGFGGRTFPPRRTFEDNQVLEKHMSIYPEETELYNILQSVDRVEVALKNISDRLCQDDNNGDTLGEREVTGVARVGDLAKTLMLRGDNHVQLVVMCSNKPTKSLLERIVTLLMSELAHAQGQQEMKENDEEQRQENEIQEDDLKFDVSKDVNIGEISVKCQFSTIKISLTSTHLRNDPMTTEQRFSETSDERLKEQKSIVKEEKPDVVKEEEHDAVKEEKHDAVKMKIGNFDLLSPENGLKALAEVRRAKWFTAMALPLPSCVEALRVMKDKARRDPAWRALGDWALELLVERSLFSVGFALSPSKSILRIMEVVAGGLLLPDGLGIKDPCEREDIDAFEHMTNKDREEITRQAQIDLRNIHFKKIDVVLGMKRHVRPHEMESALIIFKKEGEHSVDEEVEKSPV